MFNSQLISPSFIYLNFNCSTHICLRLQKNLLPAAILDFISSLIRFFEFVKARNIYNSEPLKIFVREEEIMNLQKRKVKYNLQGTK